LAPLLALPEISLASLMALADTLGALCELMFLLIWCR
jgi:hypothetical protein